MTDEESLLHEIGKKGKEFTISSDKNEIYNISFAIKRIKRTKNGFPDYYRVEILYYKKEAIVN